MRHAIFLTLFLLLFQSCQTSGNTDPVVSTEKGYVKGSYNLSTGVYSFKGIPYAKAPTGDLRWQPPQAADEWESVFDATSFGPICIQAEPVPFSMWTREFIAPAGNMSEDCLNLNIWTQLEDSEPKKPVIVYIHGGAFTSGSGSVPVYDGEKMAEKGVVFVTINYRVGVFGFLAHPELSNQSPNQTSGNYGLMDQIAALRWVQNNIAQFGGDPNRVTIAGQSAGSASVNYLVASPLARGLFHAAIAQSGAAFLPSHQRYSEDQSLQAYEERGLEVQESLNASGIDELRSLPADSIISSAGQSWSPISDGYVIPDRIYSLFEEGLTHDVPLLTGWNEDEGITFGPMPSKEEFRDTIQQQFEVYAEELLSVFPAETDSLARQSHKDLAMLNSFGIQNWKWAVMQNKTGNAPVYLYHFTRDLPYSPDQEDFGAFHTGEVPYAYNTLHKSDRPWSPTDYNLAETMSSYWVNFAKTGNPNGPGLTEWPPARPQAYQTIYLGDRVYVDEVPMRNKLELLDRIYTQRLVEN